MTIPESGLGNVNPVNRVMRQDSTVLPSSPSVESLIVALETEPLTSIVNCIFTFPARSGFFASSFA